MGPVDIAVLGEELVFVVTDQDLVGVVVLEPAEVEIGPRFVALLPANRWRRAPIAALSSLFLACTAFFVAFNHGLGILYDFKVQRWLGGVRVKIGILACHSLVLC